MTGFTHTTTRWTLDSQDTRGRSILCAPSFSIDGVPDNARREVIETRAMLSSSKNVVDIHNQTVVEQVAVHMSEQTFKRSCAVLTASGAVSITAARVSHRCLFRCSSSNPWHCGKAVGMCLSVGVHVAE